MNDSAAHRLIDELRASGITDERVLTVMASTPRDRFVGNADRAIAWLNTAMPIGHDQTISQPVIVARMTECVLSIAPRRVLEIGTGSGYQAAILAGLVESVHSVERIRALHERAAGVLTELGYDNVQLRHGDGADGWPEAAPFDAVILTAATREPGEVLTGQIREGGIVIAPLEDANGAQWLTRLVRRGGEWQRQRLAPVRFVPLRQGVSD
ncbi:protein-L-isoaspartate(D-aspartate) O-methyltransferase [Kushneria phosphatilytica]|uniref:Protein-L-isoaspartate O-methyltransferase n=1 Tax=Kushneria phosphatilytica TaxID=657387 RepID=A0A1S1NV67_9GAMM|nr:protein-L-isoaspartate(D-aspartate) O-methyltransferase [Kushneria phosphatilytica]OHV10602.1 protein-L-isoaspartate O-methyltransferase [Kushneria phosphatilytica]QEL11817.1 protein-L-isoaspartate(D-aspartate) O-methyltransferase [Kushneria phosphatilytica]